MYKDISDNYQRKNYKVGIYCRLSNEDGEEGESNSIGNQKAILTNYVMSHGWDIVDTYIDDGYTGINFDRPGFNRMIEDIKDKRINLVVTKDLSRLGRDYIRVGYYLEIYFPENRIRYIAVNDNIDTEKESSNDMTPFRAVINDMYSKDISKKVKSVFNHKRHEGKYIGAFAAYGYQKDPLDKNKLIIDEEAAPIVKKIFSMYLAGHGLTYIARRLNDEGIVCPSSYKTKKYGTYNTKTVVVPKWCHSSVKSIINNPVFTGAVAQGKHRKINYKSKKQEATNINDWIVVKGMHEPIIAEQEFKQVQQLLNSKKNNDFKGSRKATRLFSGFAFCGDCGQYMTYTKSQARDDYLICSAYKRFGKDHCTRHSITEETLQDLILSDFRDLAYKYADKEKIRKKAEEIVNGKKDDSKAIQNELHRIEKRQAEVKQMLKSLYEDKVRGVIAEDQMLELYEQFNKERINLDAQHEEVANKLQSKAKVSDKETQISKLVEAVLNIKKLNRLILFELIEKVEIFEDEGIKVYYKMRKPY